MKENEKEKQNKAGNPLFVIIIFIALIGFLFVIPEVYKKYNKEIADFLGVGKDEAEIEKEKENEQDNIEPTSDFFPIPQKSTFTYNEFEVNEVLLENKSLIIRLSTKDTVDLKTKNYYIEFYDDKSKFMGRRRLNGIVTRALDVKVDVSNLTIRSNTYFRISHIPNEGIPSIDLDREGDKPAELVCTKGNYTYSYEFNDKVLNKVTKKYTYTNNDLNEYATALLEYQKKQKEYSELTGVTADIVESNNSFIFASSFEYDKVKNFSRIQDDYLFEKEEKDNIVNFRMEAEGFDCQ